MGRYPALGFLIGAASVIAWALGILLVLAGIFALTQRGTGLPAALGIWVLAVLVWVYVKAGAELIQVFVRIEENTRPRP